MLGEELKRYQEGTQKGQSVKGESWNPGVEGTEEKENRLLFGKNKTVKMEQILNQTTVRREGKEKLVKEPFC